VATVTVGAGSDGFSARTGLPSIHAAAIIASVGDGTTLDAFNEGAPGIPALSGFGLGTRTRKAGPTDVAAAVSTVSETVTVPADAVWTFEEPELTVTSTLPSPTEVDVRLRGHQAEIDRCAGPVLSDYGAYGKVIGEHNHCGGAYVLEFEVGDVVGLTGYQAGDYVVAFLKDVPKKNTPVTVLSGADLFLQTCHFTGGQMRLVALAPQ
jgi:hypothetical protein